MAAYIALIISSICLILLITILIKFKRLFSTESIIEKTKNQMNKIISDINNNANRDIDLINAATKRTRNLLLEADAKMEEFKEASRLLRDMIATIEKDSKINISSNTIYRDYSQLTSIPQIDDTQSFEKNDSKQSIKTNKKISPSPYKTNAYKMQQQSLFDEPIKKDDKKDPITQENLMPKIVTNIIPDNVDRQDVSINDKVEKLFGEGMEVEEIASQLSCSITEVQFIIDMLSSTK